jgi:hypothetical protein
LSLVFIPLQMLFPLHKERTFRATTLSDLRFYFVSTFLPPFVLLIALTVAAYFAFKIVPGGWRAEVVSWPIWVRGSPRSWWPTLASTGAIVGPTNSPCYGVSIRSTTTPSTSIF